MLYSKIFEPLVIKGMKIKNRIVMPPMGTNFASQSGEISQYHMDYYEERAKGGTGLIIVENASVDFPLGSNGTTQLRIDHDSFIPALYRLTERLRIHGTRAVLQLNHSGASAVGERIGVIPVSSSNEPSKLGGGIPRALEEDEIIDIAEKFAKAAKRAQLAGFDAVEIHGGHSYLICQFLSPLYNKREDKYGGSIENRARFAKLINEKVRNEVGHNYPIFFRVSADEFFAGGNQLKDTISLLEYFHTEIDVFSVSCGVNDSIEYQIDKMDLPEGWKSYISKEIRDKFNKPTIITGNIRSPIIAEQILSKMEADLIGIGRGLIAEPYWVKKVMHGKEDEIIPCISCNIGCAGHRIGLNRPIRCTVNPEIVYRDIHRGLLDGKQVKALVIGGGISGLEAACSLSEAGCEVLLLEETQKLGGIVDRASQLPNKSKMKDYINYLIRRAVDSNSINIRLGISPGLDDIKIFAPDVVVEAIGSEPLIPEIEGLRKYIDAEESSILSVEKFLDNIAFFETLVGKKVVIIGGGAVGLDLADFLGEMNDIVLVEKLNEVGKDLDVITRNSMLSMLKEYDVEVKVSSALKKIDKKSVLVTEGNVDLEIEFDFAFVCLGLRSKNLKIEGFEDYIRENGIVHFQIGDSNKPRKIIDGSREGREICYKINELLNSEHHIS